MLKIKQTKRKFYGKWLYKATFSIYGISILRMFPRKDLRSILLSDNTRYIYRTSVDRAKTNKDNIIKFLDIVESFNDTSWASRIESNLIDFYTNDEESFNKMLTELDHIAVKASAPLKNKNILESTNFIPVSHLPHKKYRYKVYIKPHVFNGDKESKTKYLNWVFLQKEKILISDTVKNWFIKTNWNWDRRYIYVEDEGTLILLKMRNPEALGRIYEYQIVDK
jgi:hypothetical protein